MQNHKYTFPLILGVGALVYFIINYMFLFSFTAPSDPLQYVGPALYPEHSFPFIDRILLWLWIRLIANIPFPLEYIGGIATLILTTSTLFISCLFLEKRVGFLGASVFLFLYILSPIVTGIASYTYPMQLLSFLLVVLLISVHLIKQEKLKMFIAGFGFVLLLLSKIQGYSFVFIIFYLLYERYSSYKTFFSHAIYLLIGGISAIVSITLLLFYIDGVASTLQIFSYYFNDGVGEHQLVGLHTGVFPAFYLFLFEPSVIFSIAGIFLLFFDKSMQRFRLFAVAGLAQILGILLVYAITKRGGSIVANYFLDSYILGVLCFSIWFGVRFRQSVNYIYSILLIVSAFLGMVFWLSYGSTQMIYVPEYEINYSTITYITLLLMIIFAYQQRFKKYIFISIIPVFIIIMCSEKAIGYSLFLKEHYNRYHDICRFMIKGDIKWQDNICVLAKITTEQISNGMIRLRNTCNTFYPRKNNDPNISFLKSFNALSTNSCKVILSDIPEVYTLKHPDTTKIPLFPPLFDSGIQLKQLKSMTLSDFRLIGARGDGTLKKVSYNSDFQLNFKPNNEKARYILFMDFSKKDENYEDSTLFLSTKNDNNSEEIIKLYIRYQLNKKWIKKESVIKNGKIGGISLYIPKNAILVNFGYYVVGANEIKLNRINFLAMKKDSSNKLRLWIS